VSTVGVNHVSVNARDLRESVNFYVELLGAEPMPSPNFGVPVQWLAVGGTQLHLFERDVQPPSHHHFAVTVELPGDVVQLYLRDPAGNLLELDQAGADRLPDDMRAALKGIWEISPQSEENMRGRLFVP
jgi:catechol 2,3-dioxygenase-like lactoylglutathione lyase family enzyme